MSTIFLIGVMLAAEPLPTTGTEPNNDAQVAADTEPASQPVRFHKITPIPQDASKPAYQLYVETDLPLVGLALVM